MLVLSSVFLIVVFLKTHLVVEYFFTQRVSASKQFSISLKVKISYAHFTYLFHMDYSVGA